MASPAYGSLEFAEQIAFFRQKVDLPTQRWFDLWQEAHDRAFVVSGAMQADLLADLHGAVLKGIAEGTTLETFRKDFKEIVARTGWTGWTGEGTAAGRAWRTRVIYETNLRTSYAAGRWAQIQEVKSSRPYLLYRHNDNVLHPRPLHQAWNGKILAADDPWWQTHYPPNGWGCQCTAFAVDEEYLRRQGKAGPDPAPDDGTYDWQNPKTGEWVRDIPNGIDPGWAYSPGASLSLDDFVAGKVAKLPGGLGRALGQAVASKPLAPQVRYWDPTTPDGAWHKASFASAPDWMRRAIQKAGNIDLIPAQPGRGAYQHGGKIHMGLEDMATAHGQGTWRHEFGHLLDFKSGPLISGKWHKYKSVEMIDLMDKDGEDLKRLSGVSRKSKAQDARIEALNTSYTQVRREALSDNAADIFDQRARAIGLNPDRLDGLLRQHTVIFDHDNAMMRRGLIINAIVERDAQGLLNALEGKSFMLDGVWGVSITSSKTFYQGSEGKLSDLFSAATRKKIEGSGSHSAQYYKDGGKAAQATEVVANITTLLGDEFSDQWEVILERMMPGMTKAWREHLQTWGQ